MNKYGIFVLVVWALILLWSLSQTAHYKGMSNSWATVAGETFETAEHCLGTLNKCMDTLDTCEDLRKNKYEL